jgi:hypothetical protein
MIRRRERIQDVDQDLSSNTFPSIVEEMEDNLLELLVSILHLCIEIEIISETT